MWGGVTQAEEFPALGPTPTRTGATAGEGGLQDVSLPLIAPVSPSQDFRSTQPRYAPVVA